MEEQYIQNPEEEISLKELILKIQEFLKEIRTSWLTLLIFILPVVAFMCFQTMTTPVNYKAVLTFMVNEDEGGGNPVSSILGSFGLGGVSKSSHNLDKILKLSESREIISSALFDSLEIDGRNDYLANHIIEKFDYQSIWEDKSWDIGDFYFNHANITSFSQIENKVLLFLHKKIKGDPKKSIEGILLTGYGKETGIMSMEVNSEQEDISIHLLRNIYSHLGEFYVSNSLEKSQTTFSTLEVKADSLLTLLESMEYSLAKFEDTHRGLYTRSAELERKRLDRKIVMLGIAYGKAVENKEIAEFALKNSTPYFQDIDLPIYPLESKNPSLVMNILIGIFLGLFIGIIYIIVRKIIRDTMQ